MPRQDLSPNDIAELRAKLNGRPIVASISGGKDSAAMALFLRELGIEFTAVQMDTGWEHALTMEYIRGPLTNAIGPITEIRGELQMVELIRKKGMFPSRKFKFCTQELKIKPMQKYIRALQDSVGEVVNAVGIRRGESESRAASLEWEWSDGFDCDVWRPLVEWSEQDVIDIHARHGLLPNPLYLMGARRVGCWPCISSRKSEIRMVADTDPARIAQIRELEAEATAHASARYAKKGETFASLGYVAPAFFQSPNGPLRGQPAPIDQMVEWSRTAHGGKEYAEPAPADAGCMRWGLCDTSDTE